ncbi:ParB/RepB/Spo0J family partition protein [Thalassospira alkalitolerans]|uniref:ParB/RepB/Spo0J family partition protein n=1 Tax=Thalassospira alkalitolerans TaxID=1293890 RepID=UPI0030EB477A|tara:strand:+ start:1988 stop:2833 length:846 start_codon:yes stop_codon:yes gene_type:complete
MAEMFDIDRINVGERLRAVDPDHVAVIADSIRQCGRVLQPVAITQTLAGDWMLVAGAHRLAAARLVGLKEIPVVIHEELNGLQAKMIEIDENLLRHELNPLDRAVFLAERKRIYEQMHPETKAGVAGAAAKHGSANDTMSFAKDAAEKIGLNPRSIERAVRIATRLSPDVRRNLIGTDLSKNQKELLLLAKQEPDAQIKIVDLILRENATVKSVKAAIEQTSGKPKVVADNNLQALKKLMDAWRHAPIAARRTFVRDLSEADQVLMRDLLDMAIPDTEEAA